MQLHWSIVELRYQYLHFRRWRRHADAARRRDPIPIGDERGRGGQCGLSRPEQLHRQYGCRAGTLQLTNGSALPSGPGYGNVEVDANGTLDLDGNYVAVNGLSGAGTVTNSASWLGTLSVGASDETSEFDGVIQDGSNGSVALVKIGEGRLTLAGANTYSGGTTVAEGFLQVGNGGDSTGSLGTGNVNVTVNTSLVFYCGSNVTIANAISGSGSLTQEGADTLTLTGSDSCNSTMILAGTLQFGDGNTTGSLGGRRHRGRRLRWYSTAAATFRLATRSAAAGR